MAVRPEPKEILHKLGKVCGAKYHRMNEMLDALGLYQGQPFVIDSLWRRDGMTQSELAELLNRSPSTITKTVQRMERAGFVERKPDPDDERVSRVYLTDEGRRVKSDIDDVWHRFATQVFAGFTEDELAQLYAMLQRLHHNIKS